MVNTARFSRTCGILTASSVPILEAMKVSSEVIVNLPIRTATEDAIRRVREGMHIHRALKLTGYFPPMSIHLIASGESSGRLEEMLGRVADNQDRSVTLFMDTLLSLFEPFLIVVMGGVVLFIVLAILLPIFAINQLI